MVHLPQVLINRILMTRQRHPLFTIVREAHVMWMMDWETRTTSFYHWWAEL